MRVAGNIHLLTNKLILVKVKNPKSETEYFRDKYWGRRLKQDNMLGALSLFFFDGKFSELECKLIT